MNNLGTPASRVVNGTCGSLLISLFIGQVIKPLQPIYMCIGSKACLTGDLTRRLFSRNLFRYV